MLGSRNIPHESGGGRINVMFLKKLKVPPAVAQGPILANGSKSHVCSSCVAVQSMQVTRIKHRFSLKGGGHCSPENFYSRRSGP